jgi:putative salt-induced outer membrane protein YdiY
VWSGEAGLSYVQTGGNSEAQTLGLSLQGLHQREPWKLLARAGVLRSETAEVLSVEKWAALLRADRTIRARLSAFAQTSYLRDLFAGIERENAVDAGLLYELVKTDRHALAASAALAYTDESRTAPGEDRSFAGTRAGLSYGLKLRAGELGAHADYLFSLGDSGGSRARTGLTLTSALSRFLAVRISHQLGYVREPVPGKEKTDTELLASIVARWPPP